MALQDRVYVSTRKAHLLELLSFYESRARECAAFGEPESRLYREKADKIKLIIQTERDESIEQTE
jgi:hypothetical protein